MKDLIEIVLESITPGFLKDMDWLLNLMMLGA